MLIQIPVIIFLQVDIHLNLAHIFLTVKGQHVVEIFIAIDSVARPGLSAAERIVCLQPEAAVNIAPQLGGLIPCQDRDGTVRLCGEYVCGQFDGVGYDLLT